MENHISPVATAAEKNKNLKNGENQKPEDVKTPTGEKITTPDKKTYRAGVIDIEDLVKAQSRDLADVRMTESKEDKSKNWFVRNVKRIWKHNYMQEFYRQKEISKVRREILEKGNLYAGEKEGNESKEDHDIAMKAITDKFTSDYANEILRKEELDSKEEGSKEVNIELKKLIKSFAGGTLTEEQFNKQKDDLIFAENPNYKQEGKLYADNFLEIANQIKNEIKDSVNHGEALDKMDFDIKLTLGKARESLDTEAKRTTFDKLLNAAGKTWLGSAALNTGIGLAIAAAFYGGTKAVTLGAGRKIAKWAGFGAGMAVGAAIESAKEHARVTRERSQHIRERAKGMQFTDEDMKRREQMEKNRYETKSANDIITNLDDALIKVERGNLSKEEIRSIMENLSDFEARVKFGGEKSIDLIHYTPEKKVEVGRFEMLEKSAELKAKLRNAGLELNGDFNSNLKALIDAHIENFTEEKESKDKTFRKMRWEKVGRKFGQTLLVGSAFSFAAQEVYSLGTHEDGIIEGTYKGIRNSIDHTPGKGLAHDTTAMESLRRWALGDNPRMPFGHGVDYNINGGHIHLPEGASLVQHPDGHGYDLLANGKIISGIDFDEHGHLTDTAEKILKSNDIYFDPNTVGAQTTETVTQTADEYMKQHPAGTEKVHFKNWMGNDTEMYEDPNNPGHRIGADFNEVRTQWIGDGVDANGDYNMTVAHMTNDGSFQGGLSVAAREQMAAGKLEAILSVTKEGQHNVFRIPINPDGTFKILHDSPEGQMLFSVRPDGHAQFDGAYLQIAHPDGVAADGQINEQLLGALEGTENPHSVTDTVVNDTRAPDIRFDIPLGHEIEPPIPIPIVPRRPMERGSYAKKDTSKQGPAKDKGIEKVKDLQSKNPIEGAVDPLKTGAEDLTKNEKVPVTEADFDENIKNARAEEQAVFAEFSEWEKNRKTPEEKPPQDLEDRYAAAEAKVATAEKAKAEFLARTDNEPAPAPASSEASSENPVVVPTQDGSENIEQKEKPKWIMVESKGQGFGITDPNRENYFYDKDGQTYWNKDRKVIRNLIDRLNKGEEIESVNDLNKEPEEQILSEKELETRYDLDEQEQDLSDKLLAASKEQENTEKAIKKFTDDKKNQGKSVPKKLVDANSVAIAKLANAQSAYDDFVSSREPIA